MKKLIELAWANLLVRAWVKAIQLDERSKGHRGNTRFRRVERGKYTLSTDLVVENEEVIDGKAQATVTSDVYGIAEFLVEREKRIRETQQN